MQNKKKVELIDMVNSLHQEKADLLQAIDELQEKVKRSVPEHIKLKCHRCFHEFRLAIPGVATLKCQMCNGELLDLSFIER